MFAFDVNTGKTLWQHNLGTIQKASPVLADGKIYVGSENGRFWILKPGQEKVEVLDEDQLGTEQQLEQIIASPAVSNGRVFLVTTEDIYCIGKKAVHSERLGRNWDWTAPRQAQLLLPSGRYADRAGAQARRKGAASRARSSMQRARFIRDEKADMVARAA